MKNETHLRPLEKEHSKLSLVQSGQADIEIDIQKVIDLMEDLTPEQIAQELYEAESLCRGTYVHYIKIHEPELVDDVWWVRKSLSSLGVSLYESLQAGMLWDIKAQGSDVQATEKWYRDMMATGKLDMKFAELVLVSKDDALRPIRNEIVYFRMRGNREGRTITALDESTD